MKAALARSVITPALPAFLAGYGDRRDPATAVHDDLEAHVLVVEVDGARAALVTLDLLVLSRDIADPIRARVGEIVGCGPDAVLTSCCHVHAGPSALRGTEAIGWPVPEGYGEFLADARRRSCTRRPARTGHRARSRASSCPMVSRSIAADTRSRRRPLCSCSTRL